MGEIVMDENIQVFYKPENSWVGDFIPYYEDGEFKLFYLKNWRDNYQEGYKRGWHLITTSDFIDFKEEGACNIVGGTGSIIKIDDLYHMFYCKFPSAEEQLVCHAISKDLEIWEDITEDTFTADGKIYDKAHWRDPHVFWNKKEGEYWMLISTRTVAGKSTRTGCVGLCTSQDLKKWKYQQPLYAPGIHVGAHECADMFKIGDWWYLIYSNYTDNFRTFYRMGRSPEGPWITPANDTFDGRAFYAAKSTFDGEKYYIFGWNPTKESNHFGFNPENYQGKDYDTWDWGGSLIVHQLLQNDDGTLAVKIPDTVSAKFKKGLPLSFNEGQGEWDINTNTYKTESNYAFSSLISNEDIPSVCKISGKLNFGKDTKACGIMLRVQDDLAHGYYYRLEPNRDRLLFRSHLMQSEEGGKTFPYEAELERPVHLEFGKEYNFNIIIDDTICEFYFNDEIVMSSRIYDLKEGKLGIFVSEGIGQFTDLSINVID